MGLIKAFLVIVAFIWVLWVTLPIWTFPLMVIAGKLL